VNLPGTLEALIRELSRLPGIGPKSASRLAFHLIKAAPEDAAALARAIVECKSAITACTACGAIAEGGLCPVCSDATRDQTVLCVVENARDVLTIERTGEFRGLYHVLGGVISPLDGIGPDELSVRGLVDRCTRGAVRELIVATNPTVEGDATGLYLARLLKPLGMRVMRIAHGLPVGADLEYADSMTIARSIAGRVEM
jgi:recombination protein RecR